MRGIFSAGVLDAFLDKRHRQFDSYYGVSAGALNLLSYINNQRGRNLEIYTGACLDPRFISIKRHIKGGNLFDLDWLFDRINSLYFDQQRFRQNLKGKSFNIVTTCSNTGYPVYHQIDEHSDLDSLFKILKASSALPMIYRQPIDIDGRHLVDGTMADPMPIMKAVEDGHQHIILVRTRESDYRKKPSSGNRLMAWQFRKQPELAQLIKQQYRIYNEALDQIKELKQQGIRITEIAPQSKLACTRSTRNRTRLVSDYHRGYSEGYALLNQHITTTE